MTPTVHQITNYEFDERFYQVQLGDNNVAYAPSVTYVLDEVLKEGFGLMQWRGDVGNKRAEEIFIEAGEDGTYTHEAIKRLFAGETIDSDEVRERFVPRRCLKILRYLARFQQWCEDWQPEVVATEYQSWHPDFSYAGTVDLHCKIDYLRQERLKLEKLEKSPKLTAAQKRNADALNQSLAADTTVDMWPDFKTSNNIYLRHRLQAAAYWYAEQEEAYPVKNHKGMAALVHLDANTKSGYSFLMFDEDQTNRYCSQWLACLNLFKELNPDAKPREETFPAVFALAEEQTAHQ